MKDHKDMTPEEANIFRMGVAGGMLYAAYLAQHMAAYNTERGMEASKAGDKETATLAAGSGVGLLDFSHKLRTSVANTTTREDREPLFAVLPGIVSGLGVHVQADPDTGSGSINFWTLQTAAGAA